MRGEPVDLDIPPTAQGSNEAATTHRRWAWWALADGHLKTARKYARTALRKPRSTSNPGSFWPAPCEDTDMRVTFVLPPDALVGGIRVISIYAQRLAPRGHKVTVVQPRHPRPTFRRSSARSVATIRGQKTRAPDRLTSTTCGAT